MEARIEGKPCDLSRFVTFALAFRQAGNMCHLCRIVMYACATAALLIITGSANASDQQERLESAPIHSHSMGSFLSGHHRMRVDARQGAYGWVNPLPEKWCGVTRSSDYRVNEFPGGHLPTIKIIYARAQDQPSQIQKAGTSIQRSVRDMLSIMSLSSRNERNFRIDLGTDCGEHFVDIMEVTLTHPAAHYRNSSTFQLIEQELWERWETLGLYTQDNLIVFTDELGPRSQIAGQGRWINDDRPGADNPNNQGRFIALLYAGYAHTSGVLHEVLHTLGAVNRSAPHSTGWGHCDEFFDIMCYDDGAPGFSASGSCDMIMKIYAPIDCGGGDYFEARPKSGSYLDTHWNVYNSAFLCAESKCIPPDTTAPAPVRNLQLVRTPTALRLSWRVAPIREGVDHYELRIAGKPFRVKKLHQVKNRWRRYIPLSKLRTRNRIMVRAVDMVGNRSTKTIKHFTVSRRTLKHARN